MSQSLRDQLVKAGLATSAQAKKAERSKRAEATAERQQGKSTKGKKGKEQAKVFKKIAKRIWLANKNIKIEQKLL